jgi:hypothetical protein
MDSWIRYFYYTFAFAFAFAEFESDMFDMLELFDGMSKRYRICNS